MPRRTDICTLNSLSRTTEEFGMGIDERVNVRFLIETPSFVNGGNNYLAFRDVKSRKEFYREADDIFLGLGWTVRGTTNATMDGSFVYIHPTMIKGTVFRWEVDYIADHLRRAELFAVKEIDVVATREGSGKV